VFDYLLAFAMALIVYQLQNEKPKKERRRKTMLMYAVAVLLPLPILNSAYWAQNDAIYATFVLLCVWCLLKQKYIPAFLWFGVAISIKLQAIFMLPLLVMLYFLHKKFSILSFLIPPAALWVSTLPAIFMGAGLWVGFETYFLQTENDLVLFMNYPNVHALVYDWDYENVSTVVVLGTMLVLFFMLAWLMWRRVNVQGEGLLLLAAWCPLVCAMLLPGMHDRYAFLTEILLWVWAVVYPERKKFIYAFWFSLAGYFAYASFLWGAWPLPTWVPVANVGMFVAFTWHVARTLGGGFGPLPALAALKKQTVKGKTDGA
jgi:Gpi18-like mannosyltransferase